MLPDGLGVVEEPLALDDVEGRERGGAGERVAAERTSVVPRGEQRRGPLAERDDGAYRETAAEALREREDVRRDAPPLVREPRSRASDPGLDLVDDEKRAVLVSARRRAAARNASDSGLTPASPWMGSRMIARDVVGHRRLKRGHVVRRDERHVSPDGSNGSRICGLVRHGERTQRPAVEALLERDEPGAAGLARHLERRLVRLGSRVAQEDAGAGGRVRRGRAAARRARPAVPSRRSSTRARASTPGSDTAAIHAGCA